MAKNSGTAMGLPLACLSKVYIQINGRYSGLPLLVAPPSPTLGVDLAAWGARTFLSECEGRKPKKPPGFENTLFWAKICHFGDTLGKHGILGEFWSGEGLTCEIKPKFLVVGKRVVNQNPNRSPNVFETN